MIRNEIQCFIVCDALNGNRPEPVVAIELVCARQGNAELILRSADTFFSGRILDAGKLLRELFTVSWFIIPSAYHAVIFQKT